MAAAPENPPLAPPRAGTDPRLYQIGALSLLLLYGIGALGFDVGPLRVAVVVGAALLTQSIASRWASIPFDPRSPLITALSLCLLLRTTSPDLAAAAAVVAIGSKFVLRVRGKHVFNPTNLAIVLFLGFTNGAWVSPGQWGSATVLAFFVVCLGGLVIHRALRTEVTLAFLVFWTAILFGRSAVVGEPLGIPLHRLQSGALLIFAFFMISDPKTTPDRRVGRVLFAFAVALGAGYIQFHLFRPNALLWSLALLSPLVPLLDRLLPGTRYEWAGRGIPHRRDRNESDTLGRCLPQAPGQEASLPQGGDALAGS
jgi:Na+-translocating ferredoxin:NAD+ oxidoreductase RnfD subunit